jgi:hypothetical protein
MLLKTSTIEIQIVREEHNLPVIFDSFVSGKAKKTWLPICVLAYATPASTPWTLSMTMILGI